MKNKNGYQRLKQLRKINNTKISQLKLQSCNRRVRVLIGNTHFTHVKDVKNIYPTYVIETIKHIFIQNAELFKSLTLNSIYKYNIPQHIRESLGPDKDMKKKTILGELLSL